MKIFIPSTNARLGKSIVNLVARQLPVKTLDATIFTCNPLEQEDMLLKVAEAADLNEIV